MTWDILSFRTFADIKANNITTTLRRTTGAARFVKLCSRRLQSFMIALATTNIKRTEAIFLQIFSNRADLTGNLDLMAIPKVTGIVVIEKIPIITFESGKLTSGESFIKLVSAKLTIKGKVTILAKLVTAVRDIESAESPFARWVIILEVTPPGQAARIIRPTAYSGARPNSINKKDKAKAITGREINCRKSPSIKAFGNFLT